MSADSEGGEVERLARLAASANIATAVAELQGGATVQFFQRETDAYVAQAGDVLTDDGLAAWLKGREAEMNAAWRSDVAAVTGDAAESPDRMAPPPNEIREAAAAWERDGADLPPRHYETLVRAVLARRGPFARFLEREMRALGPGDDPNARIVVHRAEMRRLFRADLEAVIKDAGSGP